MQSIGVQLKNGGRRPPIGHLLPQGDYLTLTERYAMTWAGPNCLFVCRYPSYTLIEPQGTHTRFSDTPGDTPQKEGHNGPLDLFHRTPQQDRPVAAPDPQKALQDLARARRFLGLQALHWSWQLVGRSRLAEA